MVKKHFCHIFMEMNPLEILLQGSHIDVRVDRLASGQHVYDNHPFTVPKTHHDLAGLGNFLKLFLLRRGRVMPLNGLPFCLGLEVMNPRLKSRDDGGQEIVTLSLPHTVNFATRIQNDLCTATDNMFVDSKRFSSQS
jgi:hypothetical protein